MQTQNKAIQGVINVIEEHNRQIRKHNEDIKGLRELKTFFIQEGINVFPLSSYNQCKEVKE